MESNRSKNTGSTSSGYQAVIELPEWVSDLVQSARPTKEQLAVEGWASAEDIAQAIGSTLSCVHKRFRRLVKAGEYESKYVIPSGCKAQKIFYRPKPPTP